MPQTNHTPSENPSTATWLVACLCAEWCGACREFRAAFDALSARHSDVWFRWIDVEDEAELVDDIVVNNFPTLVIQRGADVLFLGTTLPNTAIVERQLAVLRAGSTSGRLDAPDLLARLTP